MGNDARKWLPLALIAAAVAATGYAVRDLPPTVTVDLRGLLPFHTEPTGDMAPRWVAIIGIPLLAAGVWGIFQLGRSRAGLRFARRLFPDAPDVLADPASVERFRASYDSIGLWIVVLVLGVHVGMIAAALGHTAAAPRLMVVIMGISLAAVGNVMPRLRPNVVAGIRTRATLTDPQLWRATHRILGFGFVIAGILTAVVGLLAPAYGLPTAVATLVIALIAAAIGGARARRAGIGAVMTLGALALCAPPAAAQQPAPTPVVTLEPPGGVTEERFTFARLGVTLDGTLALPAERARGIPVVLIVAGSGPTDRNANGPLLNTNAYAMLAWQLAQAGFASARYDKRGIGASRGDGGDPTTLSTSDYVADAMEAAKMLAADSRFSRVYLLGHSEGAGHVLQAANRGTPNAGVIMVAPQGRPLAEILHEQFGRQTDSATVARIDSAFAQYLRGENPTDVPPIAAPIMIPAYRTFMRSMAAYDPEGEVRQLRQPLLILQGTTDVQITMADATRLKVAHPAATLVTLEGVNHVLKSVPTTDLAAQSESYRNPRLPLAPGIVAAIVAWAR